MKIQMELLSDTIFGNGRSIPGEEDISVLSDENGFPVIHPENCVGCSICVRKCVSGALTLRDRTEEETLALKKH